MVRTIVLFVHVASAMAIIAGLGIEGMALKQLRTAGSSDEVKGALDGFRAGERVAGPAMGLTLLAGLYLAGAYWGWRQSWVDVALASIVLLAVIGGTMSGRTLGRLRASATVAAVKEGIATLRTSFMLRTAILAGIVFLMTNKTTLWPSILAIVIALALALVADFAIARRRAGLVASRGTMR